MVGLTMRQPSRLWSWFSKSRAVRVFKPRSARRKRELIPRPSGLGQIYWSLSPTLHLAVICSVWRPRGLTTMAVCGSTGFDKLNLRKKKKKTPRLLRRRAIFWRVAGSKVTYVVCPFDFLVDNILYRDLIVFCLLQYDLYNKSHDY